MRGKVQGNGSRMLIPLRPLFQSVALKRPKLRGVRGNLESMVADEGEVVKAPPQSTKSPPEMTFQRKTSPRI